MTKVRIRRTNGTCILSAEGHAEREETETGNIVCAAVSILVQTLIQFCREHLDSTTDYRDQVEDGYVFVKVETDEKEIESAFAFTETGLSLIEDRYPDRVHVIKGE